jgi:hypothetical protein
VRHHHDRARNRFLSALYGRSRFHSVSKARIDSGAASAFSRCQSLESRYGRHGRTNPHRRTELDRFRKARSFLGTRQGPGSVGGPGLSIFARLNEVGYTKAVKFDNRGEYIQTLSLSARQQLADLSDYLPGGDEFYGYCDVCAFHETDLDLCDSVRRIELETRAARRESKRRL